MQPSTTCPACTQPMASQSISLVRTFRCPQCGELLREKSPLSSFAVRTIVVAAITLALLQRVLGIAGWIAALILYRLVALLIQAVLIRVFGHTLEPVSESGRVPLGQ
jgi:hypothetical protein